MLRDSERMREVREEMAAEQKRAGLPLNMLCTNMAKKVARLHSLIESEEDEFKPMFMQTVLKEIRMDVEAMMKQLDQ
jgi:hypothetical protein